MIDLQDRDTINQDRNTEAGAGMELCGKRHGEMNSAVDP